MATTGDFRNGFTFLHNGQLYKIVEFMHVKPGKGGAFVRTKLKNVRSGKVVDNTFRAGERVEEVRIENRKMQFLYKTDSDFHFMDLATYDQISLDESQVSDVKDFLIDNLKVKILFNGNEPIEVELPPFVEVEITGTDPGVKGDTATGGSKPAVLETGAVVNVPLFVNQGEKIKVDTRSGDYVERVK